SPELEGRVADLKVIGDAYSPRRVTTPSSTARGWPARSDRTKERQGPMTTRIHVPAGTARAVTLREGQTLRIINVEGHQVADFIAYNAEDMREALSTMHTAVSIGRLFPTTGDRLRSNRRRPIVEIMRDDTGRHDMI